MRGRVLCITDFFLQMLDPDAHGKLTRLHGKAGIAQAPERVAAAVTDGKNDLRSGQSVLLPAL